jgi:hypothetical protein
MAAGRFSKQAVWRGAGLINNNYSDGVIGGTLTTSPGGSPANQGTQTYPGDRVIYSPAAALAVSNNNVGNLYTGTYRYVATLNNSTSIPQLGRAAFWTTVTAANNSTQDGLYQVTSDEAANIGVALFAGVYINNIAQGNYWWIQETGKITGRFRGNNGTILYGASAITGTPAIGAGVYLAAAGSGNGNNNVGLFDQLNASTANYAAANMTGVVVDYMLTHIVGVAESLPSNGNLGIFDVFMNRASFRW